MLVVPLESGLDRLVERLAIDVVVGDARNDDIGLRSLQALVDALAMVSVVEELLVLGDDDEHGLVGSDEAGLLDRRIVQHVLEHRMAVELAGYTRLRRGIWQLALGAAGGDGAPGVERRTRPARVERCDLRDDGLDARVVRSDEEDVAAAVGRAPQA